MSLRIIAGELKGRKIRSVRGTKTRPTANRIREAIFNILAPQFVGCRVLDLFAGTGAFGIEALSRGAESAVFIDIDPASIAILTSNLKTLCLERQSKILRWDMIRDLNCLQSLPSPYELVFMDPPYRRKMIASALQNLHRSQSLAHGTRVVVEHSYREPVATGRLPFEIKDRRKYGKTLVTILDYVI